MEKLFDSLPRPLHTYSWNELPERIRSDRTYHRISESVWAKHKRHQELDPNEWAVLRNAPITTKEINLSDSWTSVRNRVSGHVTRTQIPTHPSSAWNTIWEVI